MGKKNIHYTTQRMVYNQTNNFTNISTTVSLHNDGIYCFKVPKSILQSITLLLGLHMFFRCTNFNLFPSNIAVKTKVSAIYRIALPPPLNFKLLLLGEYLTKTKIFCPQEKFDATNQYEFLISKKDIL